MSFSQALRLKNICSETLEPTKHSNELNEFFISRSYKENFLTDQVNKISEETRKALFTSKQKTANKPRIPLVLKFNRALIEKIIDEHWRL